MRIGVVTTSYPRWPGDPAGNFVDGHVRAMRALGHDVEVIAAGDGSPIIRSDLISPVCPVCGQPSTGNCDVAHVPVARAVTSLSRCPGFGHADPRVHRIASSLFYCGGAPDLLERSPRLLDSLAFTARLAIEVTRRSRHWDAIVAHWLAPSALACLPNRLPLLAIAHGGDVHLLRRLRLLGPALRLLRRRGARLAFASSELRDLARTAAPSRWLDEAIVQPMGIDVARFASIARTPATPRKIVVAARLVPIKGVDVAIAALAHLRTPAELVIAGDGPARAELARSAPANVTFLGQVDAIDPLLRDASVVVVPSRVLANGRSEGTPTIALEAIAAGVPVIASAVGGLRDLPAVFVPPDDPRALARAIDQIDVSSVADTKNLDWGVVARRLLDHACFYCRAA